MVKQMSYYYKSGVRTSRPTCLYGYSFSLNTSQNVLSVALPANSDIKVLAMDMGSPQQWPASIRQQEPSLILAPPSTSQAQVGGEAPALLVDVIVGNPRKWRRQSGSSLPTRV
jgi:hypothetical protein